MQLIDWSAMKALLSDMYSSNMGEKAWPPCVMLKILVLQNTYAFSDPMMEIFLAHDLMFRKFVGLEWDSGTPDHSTISRFRSRLDQKGLIHKIFSLVNDQLRSKGLMISKGQVSIIDASVIEAQQSRPHRNKNGQSTRAAGAYCNTPLLLLHINVDEDGLIQKHTLTPANVHDSNELESLLTGKEKTVYADKACKSRKYDDLCKKKGIKNCILLKLIEIKL